MVIMQQIRRRSRGLTHPITKKPLSVIGKVIFVFSLLTLVFLLYDVLFRPAQISPSNPIIKKLIDARGKMRTASNRLLIKMHVRHGNLEQAEAEALTADTTKSLVRDNDVRVKTVKEKSRSQNNASDTNQYESQFGDNNELSMLEEEDDLDEYDDEDVAEALVLMQFFADVHYDECPSHVIQSNTQLKRLYPQNRIVFLGGSKCKRYINELDIEFFDVQDYSFRLEEVRTKYKPHPKASKYRNTQDRLCIERWLVIEAFMQRNSIGMILYMDSDTLLFGDINNILIDTIASKNCDIALPLDAELPVSPAFAMISIYGLKDFVDFSLQVLDNLDISPNDMKLWALYAYSEDSIMSFQENPGDNVSVSPITKKSHIVPNNFDCTQIKQAFQKGTVQRPRFRVCPLNDDENGEWIFDKNLKFGESRFEMVDPVEASTEAATEASVSTDGDASIDAVTTRIKRVTWIGNQPYFTTKTQPPQLIMAVGLHFQGKKKQWISKYKLSDTHDEPSCKNYSPDGEEVKCQCTSGSCDNCGVHCYNPLSFFDLKDMPVDDQTEQPNP